MRGAQNSTEGLQWDYIAQKLPTSAWPADVSVESRFWVEGLNLCRLLWVYT